MEEPIRRVESSSLPIRVTEQNLDVIIAASRVQYYRFPGTTHTVCCIKTPSGYTLIGDSACINEEDYDKEAGEKFAMAKARAQLHAVQAYWVKMRAFHASYGGRKDD
jgi:hypothetical protein